MPAPSPITKPSRSSIIGTEAAVGSSLKPVESARAGGKAGQRDTVDAAFRTPATITSASPQRDQAGRIANGVRPGRAGA